MFYKQAEQAEEEEKAINSTLRKFSQQYYDQFLEEVIEENKKNFKSQLEEFSAQEEKIKAFNKEIKIKNQEIKRVYTLELEEYERQRGLIKENYSKLKRSLIGGIKIIFGLSPHPDEIMNNKSLTPPIKPKSLPYKRYEKFKPSEEFMEIAKEKAWKLAKNNLNKARLEVMKSKQKKKSGKVAFSNPEFEEIYTVFEEESKKIR